MGGSRDNLIVLRFSVIIKQLGGENYRMAKLCDFGKSIKKRLVDNDRNQMWLIEQVKQDTGLYFDDSYLYKILTGQSENPTIVASIRKILQLDGA